MKASTDAGPLPSSINKVVEGRFLDWNIFNLEKFLMLVEMAIWLPIS